jgi:OmpR family response regulator RpaB
MRFCNQKILVFVEKSTLKTLLAKLTSLGYNFFLSSNFKGLLAIFDKKKLNIVIRDTMFTKLDGYKVYRKIQQVLELSVILVTALNNISEHRLGLELSAGKYIIKPFSAKNLEIHIRSIFKSSGKQAPTTPNKRQNIAFVENLVIEINKRDLVKNTFKVKLTNIEFSILKLLVENQGTHLSRKKILGNIWGFTPERNVDTRVVDVHISRLRSKIEKDPAKPTIILTIRGLGYMFPKL